MKLEVQLDEVEIMTSADFRIWKTGHGQRMVIHEAHFKPHDILLLIFSIPGFEQAKTDLFKISIFPLKQGNKKS